MNKAQGQLARGPGVAVLGTLDTKSQEFAFLRDCLQGAGLDTVVIDTGVMGEPSFAPDVTAGEVARRGGASLVELRSRGNRAAAIAAMQLGASAIVRDLYEQGRIAGAISLGGGQGSTVVAQALGTLPVGVPKLIVSTIAGVEGAGSALIGSRDITLMNSVIDFCGLSSVSRTIIANAAAAMAGMLTRPHSTQERRSKPRVAMTMFGVTTACVTAVRGQLERAGLEVLVFAATGPGDRAMEEMAADGLIDAVVDVTISQLGQAVVRGVSEAGPHRLEVAGEHGIPQVVTLGGLDIIVCHEGDPLLAQARSGSRKSHQHSPVMTVVRPTPGESTLIGAEIGRRLNTARGPVSVLIPARGLSEYSTAGGPLFDPDADHALFCALRDHLHPEIPLREVDTSINDPEFAAELVRALAAIAPELGPWTKIEELSH